MDAGLVSNRRMKDKRQKMTLDWSCGDPMMAAYVLQAASGQLPYHGIFSAMAAARYRDKVKIPLR